MLEQVIFPHWILYFQLSGPSPSVLECWIFEQESGAALSEAPSLCKLPILQGLLDDTECVFFRDFLVEIIPSLI